MTDTLKPEFTPAAYYQAHKKRVNQILREYKRLRKTHALPYVQGSSQGVRRCTFLCALESFRGIISFAARATGIERGRHDYWRQTDAAYRQLVEGIMPMARDDAMFTLHTIMGAQDSGEMELRDLLRIKMTAANMILMEVDREEKRNIARAALGMGMEPEDRNLTFNPPKWNLEDGQ